MYRALRRATFSLFTIALDDLDGSAACSVSPNSTGGAANTCSAAARSSAYEREEDWSCPQSSFWPWFFWTQYLVLQKVRWFVRNSLSACLFACLSVCSSVYS